MSDIADFDIERPIGEERPLPLYEPQNNEDPRDNRNQAQNLLRDIARAFRDVAQHEAPAAPRENNWVHVRTFKGEEIRTQWSGSKPLNELPIPTIGLGLEKLRLLRGIWQKLPPVGIMTKKMTYSTGMMMIIPRIVLSNHLLNILLP